MRQKVLYGTGIVVAVLTLLTCAQPVLAAAPSVKGGPTSSFFGVTEFSAPDLAAVSLIILQKRLDDGHGRLGPDLLSTTVIEGGISNTTSIGEIVSITGDGNSPNTTQTLKDSSVGAQMNQGGNVSGSQNGR